MHYEVYIDVLFFTNFMMDSLLLLAVRKVLGIKNAVWRLFLGSMTGAVLTCLVFVIPMSGIIKTILNLFGVSTVMLMTGLGLRTWKEWQRAIGALFVSAFLLGGILQIFQPYLHVGSLFFTVSVISYLILSGCWKLLIRIRDHQKRICDVIVYEGEKCVTFQALIDTGNRLTDPISREPVHVIDIEAVKQLGIHTLYGLRYIPYRTVNGRGVMPVIHVEKMCIEGEREVVVERPILGICGEMISEQSEYQMILNADIL